MTLAIKVYGPPDPNVYMDNACFLAAFSRNKPVLTNGEIV